LNFIEWLKRELSYTAKKLVEFAETNNLTQYDEIKQMLDHTAGGLSSDDLDFYHMKYAYYYFKYAYHMYSNDEKKTRVGRYLILLREDLSSFLNGTNKSPSSAKIQSGFAEFCKRYIRSLTPEDG
jgi:hypothetical protein